METRILVSTAISGGSLRQLLEEAVSRHGAARLALGLEPLAMDFPIPCPSGVGRSLSREELQRLRAMGEGVFFSEALCAKYFAYCRGTETRLVLFDDESTLRRKRELARSLGITEFFLIYAP